MRVPPRRQNDQIDEDQVSLLPASESVADAKPRRFRDADVVDTGVTLQWITVDRVICSGGEATMPAALALPERCAASSNHSSGMAQGPG